MQFSFFIIVVIVVISIDVLGLPSAFQVTVCDLVDYKEEQNSNTKKSQIEKNSIYDENGKNVYSNFFNPVIST